MVVIFSGVILFLLPVVVVVFFTGPTKLSNFQMEKKSVLSVNSRLNSTENRNRYDYIQF